MLDQHLHESSAVHFDADPDPGQIATTQPEQPLNKLCDSGTRMWNRALTHDLATVVDNANLMRLCRPVNADKQRIVIALHICSSCSGRCDARSPLYGRSQAQTPHGPLIAGQTSRAQVPPRHSQCRGRMALLLVGRSLWPRSTKLTIGMVQGELPTTCQGRRSGALPCDPRI